MAKKRFTDDLFGLFEEPQQQASARPGNALPEEEQVDVDVAANSDQARKKLSSKRFTKDLDAFLSDGFDREPKAGKAFGTTPGRIPARRRTTGLDLLIRSTVNPEDERSREESHQDNTKRVTLIFNKEHLDELKEHAKMRGLFLKDVVQEMVARYLEKE
ncbi:hypothetical protein QWY85_04730 [Neolewinella lacunae]|uniref:Uncharacterized protein n=1 Tax=Neolewinella lacunae TaxID=1517758 RepID=A0A923T8X6_9BACT|nr:hypothetical protein [Neolewinella lacunae]MBC6996100.1 hypothetical protein [Neolewinella lacunae]MDN3633953.1 hypothetical protein [Neolewinella lacunae]